MKLMLRNFTYMFLPSLIVFNSCIPPRFYTPNTAATPLFEDKKSVYIDLNTNCVSKCDFYGGRAFTPNLGAYLGLNASMGDSDPLWLFPGPNYSSKTISPMIGLGYFRNIEKSKTNRLECFAEYSWSYFDLFGSSYRTDYLGRKEYSYMGLDGKYNKFSLNFNTSKRLGNTHNGLNVRIGAVKYYDFMNDDDGQIEGVISKLDPRKIYPTVDIGYNLLAGSRGVKFKMQVYLSYGHLPVISDISMGVNYSNTIGIVYMPRYRGK